MGTSSPAVFEAGANGKALLRGKRQHRSPEIKRKIVEETLAEGASVARVARAHGVNANQVFQWPAAAELAVAEPSDREASGTQPGTIHLELRKAQLRIEGNVDPAILRVVLKALLG